MVYFWQGGDYRIPDIIFSHRFTRITRFTIFTRITRLTRISWCTRIIICTRITRFARIEFSFCPVHSLFIFSVFIAELNPVYCCLVSHYLLLQIQEDDEKMMIWDISHDETLNSVTFGDGGTRGDIPMGLRSCPGIHDDTVFTTRKRFTIFIIESWCQIFSRMKICWLKEWGQNVTVSHPNWQGIKGWRG